MAEFPGEASNAIAKIVSSVIPPNASVYLVALVPGLFFEMSIVLANPPLSCELAARAHDGGLGKYVTWAVAVFFAFIIGTAFLLAVLLIQRILGYFYRLWLVLWEELCRWPLSAIVTWLGRKRWFGSRLRCREFAERVHLTIQPRLLDEGARKLWSVVARALLKTKYGIDAKVLDQDEWDALYWTLGILRIEDIRGGLAMVVFEATGWCGLAAIRFAPTLRNRHYVVLCVAMVVFGLLHDWYVVAGLNNPTFLGALKTRSLLREFSKPENQPVLPKPHGDGHGQPEEPEGA